MSTASGDAPNLCTPVSSIDGQQSINRYWTLTGGGVAPSNFKIKLNYVSADIDNPTPSSSTRAIYSNAGGLNWVTTGGTYVRSGLSTELSGFTAFGDFVVGTPYASPGIVSQMGPTDSTNVGIATSFTITASGSYPQYQWQKNGVNQIGRAHV